MYAWYFPKDAPIFSKGHRHEWAHVVVWLNDPAVERPSMLGFSSSTYENRHIKYTPPPALFLYGTHVMIEYIFDARNRYANTVIASRKSGEFQDLIMWEQLTDSVRAALQETDFGEKVKVPFIDANFENSNMLGRTSKLKLVPTS